MRTTVNFADDVWVAVERRRRELGIGLSEAINDLIRAGVAEFTTPRQPFVQRTHDFGEVYVDVTNVAEVIETLEGAEHR